ncbi:MAG: hypothetical protein CMQ46_01080 [Gammaproteobacteria bacterium]|nr:hypothetical protein [Gammaproteobacteria bacterium]MBJ53842.1 hypothetical protein [Gammaproteobacteria bacterium]|tara:strand:+ start:109 stop:642 length:534 start_codon:yes stop_codon:yes gene_type:complete
MNIINLKKVLLLTSVVLTLAACASQPAYRAADNGGYGYSHRELSQNQFRVQFRGRGDDTGRAMDYAMLRASELTLEKGYDWFDVVSRDTLVNSQETESPVSVSASTTRYATVQDCGLLTCTTYQRPVPQYSAGVSTTGDSRSTVEVIMEIRMGSGERPSEQNSYDAQDLYSRLKPEV